MTTDKEALYPYLTRQLHASKDRFLSDPTICQENKDIIEPFLNKLRADGTSVHQQISYLRRLKPIAQQLGVIPFKTASKRDMEKAFANYREHLKQSSVNKTVECVKHFYRWLYDLSPSDPAPEAVRWLRRESEPSKIRAEDLWTQEDVEKVISLSNSLRTKAMIAVAYESGARPGELRSLKIRDVVFNGNGIVKITVRGKQEKKQGDRIIPLLRCRNILRVWMDHHPFKDNPDAWLWTTTRQNKPIGEAYFRLELRELAKKAGIRKPSHPYSLRHTALTKFYKEISNPIARRISGHVGNSKMVDVYCHLGEEDVENAVMEMHGARQQVIETKPICFSCSTVLDIGMSICNQCGKSQSQEAATKSIEMEDRMAKLARFAEIVIEKAEKNPRIKELLEGSF